MKKLSNFQKIYPYFKKNLAVLGRLLCLKNTPRYISAALFSVLFHAAFIFGYISLDQITKPEILEIREISFVDLTGEPPAKAKPQRAEPVMMANSTPEVKKVTLPETIAGAQLQPRPDIDPGMLVKRKDMIRRQAPINLDKKKSISLAKSDPMNLVRVSPAKGTKNDNMVLNATAINLDRTSLLKLVTTTEPQLRIQPDNNSIPELSLQKKNLNSGYIASTSSQPLLPQALEDKDDIFAASKTSRVVITGPLKSRKIVDRAIPQFPLWAKKKGVGAAISLQFTVMENGSVRENVIVLRTSGAKEWDDIVIESLKKWRFVALAGTSRLDQTGVITFQFVLD